MIFPNQQKQYARRKSGERSKSVHELSTAKKRPQKTQRKRDNPVRGKAGKIEGYRLHMYSLQRRTRDTTAGHRVARYVHNPASNY
jgi:hypothetical protein